MKKLVLLGLFTGLLLSSIQSTYANSGPPIRGIQIQPTNCTQDYVDGENLVEFPGNFDILVKKDDFKDDDFGAMTPLYQSFYPFYADVEYLDNFEEGWTSFGAYYQDDDHFGYDEYTCAMQFGDSNLVSQVSSIKVVYFDDQGTTLFLSEEIQIPSVYFFQDRDAVIDFNTDTLKIDLHLEPHINPYLLLIVILVVGYILYSIVIELVVALIFKLKSKKALLNILLINLITQGLMYLYFLIIFDGYSSNYLMQLFVFEVLVVIVEFGYLYWKLTPRFTWTHLAFYVVVSNVLSYALGILRYY